MTRYIPLALCLLVLPVWAGLYKWTDENGKVHYSDQPPPGSVTKSETVKQPKSASPGPAVAGAKPSTAPKTSAEQEMEFRRRRLETAEAEAKAQKEADAVAEKKRNCERATAHVASLQRGGRFTRPGPTGEQIYLNDDEVAKELVNARKSADSWCK
jgi:hypothetical protein